EGRRLGVSWSPCLRVLDSQVALGPAGVRAVEPDAWGDDLLHDGHRADSIDLGAAAGAVFAQLYLRVLAVAGLGTPGDGGDIAVPDLAAGVPDAVGVPARHSVAVAVAPGGAVRDG